MTNQVSVFIMDVSNSSKEDIGKELSEYLQQVEGDITDWTKNIVTTKITHRAGDELVVVSSGYASAYTIAFYLSRIWKFPQHQPYFGLSFGNIQEDISALNIETWIHPLMKQARIANDFLKKQRDRKQFRFEIPSLLSNKSLGVFSKQFETLLNTILSLKQEHMNEQTEMQSLVCSLYLIVGQQNKVSQYLDRSTSTISSHMKNGKTDVILHAFDDIVHVLNSLEVDDEECLTDGLQTNIKENVMNHLHNYFPKERRA